jgi:enoyl-CoA hydratase/carnithine racemase
MLLPWIAGPKRAKELLLTGDDHIDAARAERWGLVNRVVPVGREVDVALGLARTMAAMDPTLVRETKRAINRSYEIMGLGEALEAALDIDALIEGEGTADKRRFLDILRQDGLRAAIQWRDSRFAAT